MLHRTSNAALAAFMLASAAQGAMLQPQNQGATGSYSLPSALESVRVDMQAGRAVVIGGGADGTTLRRDDAVHVQGRTHLEVAVGGEARLLWSETMSVTVFGPASIEWRAQGARVEVVFHQLTWADVEVRQGEHALALPADWEAEVGRGAFRLRGISGGPTELAHHAGSPVQLEWRGSLSQPIPPVTVYPGSSVRLDKPRHVRSGPTTALGVPPSAPWPMVGADETATSVWPWKSSTNTAMDVERRLDSSRTRNEFNEIPGAPGGQVGRVRRPSMDGSSEVIEISAAEPRVLAQVPIVAERAPSYTIESGLLSKEARSTSSSDGPSAEVEHPAGARMQALEQLGTGALPEDQVASMDSMPLASEHASEAARAKRWAVSGSGTEPLVAFQRGQWRGLNRNQINGVGSLAAERGTGVEVRVIGGGRTKVFVSTSSPSPRWCFTPHMDYQLQPGAVAVFEPDGSLKMSFGTIESQEPLPGRPAFHRLAPR